METQISPVRPNYYFESDVVEEEDVEILVNHFYVFDNIAAFPMSTGRDVFPVFMKRVAAIPVAVSADSIAFVAVTSQYLITASTFDTLPIFGLLVINARTKVIEHFHAEDIVTQTRLLDTVLHKFISTIRVNIEITPKTSTQDADLAFLLKYGFANPQRYGSGNTLQLSYKRKYQRKFVFMQILSITAATQTDSHVCTLNLFIPLVVATTLSKCVRFMTESAGNLSIVKYGDMNGSAVALVGLSSDNIVEGGESSANLPDAYSPLVFHSHPDKVTREYKAFISWPSGQDMMSVALSYLQYRNQLLHIVAAPEGAWVITLAYSFQRILAYLRRPDKNKCAVALLESIYDVFTRFEQGRLSDLVEPIQRNEIRKKYTEAVRTYTLTRLFKEFPELGKQCKALSIEDSSLFNTFLIKWDEFGRTPDAIYFGEKGVILNIKYFYDPEGGSSSFIFPF